MAKNKPIYPVPSTEPYRPPTFGDLKIGEYFILRVEDGITCSVCGAPKYVNGGVARKRSNRECVIKNASGGVTTLRLQDNEVIETLSELDVL
jgi:hypothetical protein